MNILLAFIVFVSAMGIDFCNIRYIQAVSDGRPHRAAFWSVCQWTSSLLPFLIAFKVSLWLLPIEALGLWAGVYLSMRLGAKVQKS